MNIYSQIFSFYETELALKAQIAKKVVCFSYLLKCLRASKANSVDPDQTAPKGAVCSGFTLFASILNSSVMLGNYLQQTTSADVIFQMHFFLVASSVYSGKNYFIHKLEQGMNILIFTDLFLP